MTQISTNVQQTMEVVLQAAAALTPRAASRVPVNLDILMTEPPAKASQLKDCFVHSVSKPDRT